ncbi:hypothetical protein F5141DRAFT_1065160 [Pisolithus sp. B1]|nr:hypothetical protein F5141DRAFT_1065160 [Pisolithus sp. B1]
MGIPDGFCFTFIGGLVSTMLYGTTTLQERFRQNVRPVVNLLLIQVYVYYMHYSEDTFTIKMPVSAIWTLDTLHVSFVTPDHQLRHSDKFELYYLVRILFHYKPLPNGEVMQVSTSIGSDEYIHGICNSMRLVCRPQLKWLVTAPIMLFVLAQFGYSFNDISTGLGMGILILVVRLIDRGSGILKQITYYDMTPAWVIIIVAEVLITVSLCVVFNSSNSGPITKRLLNTLIIYAVNRCLLTSNQYLIQAFRCGLVAIADLVVTDEIKDTWTVGLDFVLGQLYTNSFLATLNSRAPSDLRISTIRFADPPEPPRDVESSKDGASRFDVHKVAVIDVSTTNPALDKTTASRKEGEV